MDQNIKEIIDQQDWYHTIDLGEYGLTNGTYNHDIYVPYYGFTPELAGKSVLDVGAGDGYFSFFMEELGANVTAVNPPGFLDEDYLPLRKNDWENENSIERIDRLQLAKDIRGSKVQIKKSTIYDISPAKHGEYDIVFCGSVLCHLMNPLQALIKLFNVTREKLILSTLVLDPDHHADYPYCLFTGEQYTHTFFIPTIACLESWVRAAGFDNVTRVSVFDLRDTRDGQEGGMHATIHATKNN